ncbi:Hypothetical Protein MfeM64YM_0260 [Mycoplasmopsis fermentans M64]|uniref:Uncharacterized protein n=1 Tax=Mycoplasmopsis fermentans (strain M64) TaxID=943945 RepID=A0AB32XB01_MYCFM|nr:hypothetical protein MFE_02060 [Mycoplasmopsis fermentans JER]ADV34265.1 Hypothetical Protein MfeM64YM_0260 [Mycoplasmopsis fermentans M64]
MASNFSFFNTKSLKNLFLYIFKYFLNKNNYKTIELEKYKYFSNLILNNI